MKIARIENGVVVAVQEWPDETQIVQPGLFVVTTADSQMVKVDDTVQAGSTHADGKFGPPPPSHEAIMHAILVDLKKLYPDGEAAKLLS